VLPLAAAALVLAAPVAGRAGFPLLANTLALLAAACGFSAFALVAVETRVRARAQTERTRSSAPEERC
jgi:hypothetical protein